MKSKFLSILIGFLHFSVSAQCDVSIIDYDYTTGDLTIDIINSENCGCNEFTINDSECGGNLSPIVQNNETVSNFVLGLHIPGLDEGWTECVDNTYHVGWTWKIVNFSSNTDFDSGDTWNVNVYEFSSFSNDCWGDILDYAQDNEICAELVVWQINLSQTAEIGDGGWAVSPNTGNQTQAYPDVDIINNSFLICPPLPCDTIILTEYIYETDTIEIIEYVYETDTVFVETIVYEYITDTTFIYITDTIIEYRFIEIDCASGLPCSEVDDPLVVYIPNTFTPNNDGINDAWKVILDPEYWTDVEVRVFNRWGVSIWEMYDPYYLIWDGSNMRGNFYVPDGVYFWTFTGRKLNTTVMEELTGTVTIFR